MNILIACEFHSHEEQIKEALLQAGLQQLANLGPGVPPEPLPRSCFMMQAPGADNAQRIVDEIVLSIAPESAIASIIAVEWGYISFSVPADRMDSLGRRPARSVKPRRPS